MQAAFLVVYLTGLAYLAFARRRFDMHAVAYLAACAYFLPGLYGYTLYPTGLIREPVPLADATYTVMIFVLGSLVAGMFVMDAFDGGQGPRLILKNSIWLAPAVVGLACVGFVLSLATSGSALLSADKPAMMETLNRWHILWATASVLGLAITCEERRWRLAAVPALLLLADLYIGFRSAVAVALITLFVLHLVRSGRQRFLLRRRRLVAGGTLVVLGLFAYKQLYIAIKLGRLDLVVDKITDPGFVALAIGQSEPFGIQAILDAVLRAGFTAPAGHFMSVLYQAIVFAPSLGADTATFNDLMQPRLFPFRIAGMASNVWAEMYATGGWLLLGGFVWLFNVVLGGLSWLIRATDPRLRGFFAAVACYWAFYIHRNDLAYQLNLEKRLALVFLCAWVVSSGVLIAVRAWSDRRTVGDPGSTTT